jgi:dephospho-CoA kinase
MRVYVISGGTGSGKTATINELRKEGFNVVEEAARKILESMGKTPYEVERDFLQRKIFSLQEKQILEISPKLNIVLIRLRQDLMQRRCSLKTHQWLLYQHQCC